MVLAKERQPPIIEEVNSGLSPEEVVAYCPVCKALQTLWFIEGRLTPTRKFNQHDGEVYHDCGSLKPCRLYHNY